MSRAIRSYPVEQQKAVVERRLRNKTGGLGYFAALNWTPKKAQLPTPTRKDG